MKLFLAVLLLSGLSFGGYLYYRQLGSTKTYSPTSSNSGNLILTQSSDKLGNIASVLGANISNILQDGQNILSDVTSGASEPIINQLVTKTTETLKDLPAKEAAKIKYEFCKGIVTEYESSK